MGNNNNIYSITSNIIYKLDALSEMPSGKSLLAKLRNSIGKNISNANEVWPILFENLPEEFLGSGNRSTYEEIVILQVLQLFAIMKQGSSKISINCDEVNKYKNIGFSLKVLRNQCGESVDRRFNAMITSSDIDELSNHLRHLLNILKSKSTGIYINFPKLAEDLYLYSRGYSNRIKISWAREYYKKDIEKNIEN